MNAKHLSLIGCMRALAACNDGGETPTLKLDLTIDCVCDLNAELMEFEVKSDGTQFIQEHLADKPAERLQIATVPGSLSHLSYFAI